MSRCHEHHSGNYSCCTTYLLQSPECIKFNISKDKAKKFFWGPRPHPHCRGVYQAPSARCLHSSVFKCLRHSTAPPTIFNKFTPMLTPTAQAAQPFGLRARLAPAILISFRRHWSCVVRIKNKHIYILHIITLSFQLYQLLQYLG